MESVFFDILFSYITKLHFEGFINLNFMGSSITTTSLFILE
nr:MAG TPA: hypothetical protein [Caudoviricetes sp.]